MRKILLTVLFLTSLIVYENLQANNQFFLNNLDKHKGEESFDRIILKRIKIEIKSKSKNEELINELLERYLFSLRCHKKNKLEIRSDLLKRVESFDALPNSSIEIIFELLSDKDKLLIKNRSNFRFLEALTLFRDGRNKEAARILGVAKDSRERALLESIHAAEGNFTKTNVGEESLINDTNVNYFKLLNYYTKEDLSSKLASAAKSSDSLTVVLMTNYLLMENYLIEKKYVEFNETYKVFKEKLPYYSSSHFWTEWLRLLSQKINKNESVEIGSIQCYWTKGASKQQDEMINLLRENNQLLRLKNEKLLENTSNNYGQYSTYYIFLKRLFEKENHTKERTQDVH